MNQTMADRSQQSPWHRRAGTSGVIVGALVLVALAACQPLPRPFQPDDKRLNAADFARLGTRGGIIVAAPVMDHSERAETLTGLLAAALRDRDIPALVGDRNTANRYVLSGAARAGPSVEESVVVGGMWQLTDPRGQNVMRFSVEQQFDDRSWRDGDVATLALLADAVATEMAKQFAQPAIEVKSPPTVPRERIAIWSIGGLSDERAVFLQDSTRAALRTRGLTVVAENDPAALVLSGWIEREPDGANAERITIDWVVLRPDGEEARVYVPEQCGRKGRF